MGRKVIGSRTVKVQPRQRRPDPAAKALYTLGHRVKKTVDSQNAAMRQAADRKFLVGGVPGPEAKPNQFKSR